MRKANVRSSRWSPASAALLLLILLGTASRPAASQPPATATGAATTAYAVPAVAADAYQRATRLLQTGNTAASLDAFEEAIALAPDALVICNGYRMLCKSIPAWDRPINFLERCIEDHPEAINARLSLALAYIDKIANPELAIVSQGLLSNQSIGQLDAILAEEPDNWPALYSRAMNHLHWPRALRHAPHAIRDFEACLESQSRAPEPQPYFVLNHIGLGDALVKNRDHAAARSAWQRAVDRFPANQVLQQRLSMSDEALEAFVEQARGLDIVIDTDMSFLWGATDEARLGLIDVSGFEPTERPLVERRLFAAVLIAALVIIGLAILIAARR